MTDKIADIAAGLSEAQRRAVINFHPRGDKGGLWCRTYRDADKLKASLADLRLIRKTGKATKLGKAVRNHLKGNTHD